jgi:hypothetical protein
MSTDTGVSQEARSTHLEDSSLRVAGSNLIKSRVQISGQVERTLPRLQPALVHAAHEVRRRVEEAECVRFGVEYLGRRLSIFCVVFLIGLPRLSREQLKASVVEIPTGEGDRRCGPGERYGERRVRDHGRQGLELFFEGICRLESYETIARVCTLTSSSKEISVQACSFASAPSSRSSPPAPVPAKMPRISSSPVKNASGTP